MDTAKKCELIEEFTTKAIKSGVYKEFTEYNDLGIPLATCVVAELVDIKNDAKEIIDETYLQMCKVLEVNPNKEYSSFDDLVEETNNLDGQTDADDSSEDQIVFDPKESEIEDLIVKSHERGSQDFSNPLEDAGGLTNWRRIKLKIQIYWWRLRNLL